VSDAVTVLEDDAGWVPVSVRLASGETISKTLDLYAVYYRYCDRVGEATADDRDAAIQAWAAESLGAAVSTFTAIQLAKLIAARMGECQKKVASVGTTGSSSAASPPQTNDS
jgi:hypothetical protein